MTHIEIHPIDPKLAVQSAGQPLEVLPFTDQVQIIGTGQGPRGEKGDKGDQGPPGAALSGYNHNQVVPSDTWTIDHGLGIRPNVAVTDSAGHRVEGGIHHVSDNSVVLTFSAAFSGRARLS